MAARKPLSFNVDSSPLTAKEKLEERDRNRVKMTANIKVELHRKLKVLAAQKGESVQTLLEEAITHLLTAHKN